MSSHQRFMKKMDYDLSSSFRLSKINLKTTNSFNKKLDIDSRATFYELEHTINKKYKKEINDDRTDVYLDMDTYKTSKIEKLQKLVKSENDKGLQLHQYKSNKITTLYDNEQTNVELIFRQDLNQLVIVKTSAYPQSSQDIYQEEKELLNILKGQGVTLDMVSNEENNFNQFQQIAGKTDFKVLNERIKSKTLFEVYFLMLLDKLNRMHELGVAHSDIKPKNIIISYGHEPYFIDFGASVLTSDYENYLTSYTPSFNLDVYLKREEKGFQIYKFENEEDIKLCDRTQLALTFLYLFIQDQEQNELYQLFSKKQFNELIKIVYNKSQRKNRKKIISIISRILNEADPTIDIVGNQLDLSVYIIDHKFFIDELYKLNDIVYLQDQATYKVNRIDQYSVQLMYLLHNLSQKINLNPKNMTLFPKPNQKEYQFIYQEYKQIGQYYEDLLNFNELSDLDLQNLCEYIKIASNKNCKISIKDTKQLEIILKSISSSNNLDTLKFHFQFTSDYALQNFNSIILGLDFSHYFIQIIDSQSKNIELNCEIRKGNNEFPNQISFIQFKANFPKLFVKYFRIIQREKYQIENIEIVLIIENDLLIDVIEKIQQYVTQYFEINQWQLLIKFQYKLQLTKDYFKELREIRNLYYPIIKNQQNAFEEAVKDINSIITGVRAHNNNTEPNKECSSIILSIKKLLSQKGESYILETLKLPKILLNLKQQIFNIPKQQIYKFFNTFLIQIQWWKEIYSYFLSEKDTQFIEIILVGCQFSQEIVDFFQEIQQSQDVKFGFHDIYYCQHSELGVNHQIVQTLDIPINKKLEEKKGLKISFFKSMQMISKPIQTLNDFENVQKPQQQYDQNNDFSAIQNILMNNKIYRIDFPKEVIINNRDKQKKFSIKLYSQNKEARAIKTIEEIDFIIQEIQNKVHYCFIRIEDALQGFFQLTNNEFSRRNQGHNIYAFQQKKNEKNEPFLHIDYNNGKTSYDFISKFFELYFAITQNYENFSLINNDQYKFLVCINQQSHFIQQGIYLISRSIVDSEFKYINISFDRYFFIYNFNRIKQNENQNKQENNAGGHLVYMFSLKGKELLDLINTNQLIPFIINFQQNYCFTNTDIFERSLNNKHYVQTICLSQSQIDDNAFYLFLKQAEKIFSGEQKLFDFMNNNLTVNALFYIHQVMKSTIWLGCRIKFNLEYNGKIMYYDLKKFIKSTLFSGVFHHYIFELSSQTEEQTQFIYEEFSKYINVYQQSKNKLILNNNIQKQYQTQPNNKYIIKIKLNLFEDQFDPYNLKQLPKVNEQPIKLKDQQLSKYIQYLFKQQIINQNSIDNFIKILDVDYFKDPCYFDTISDDPLSSEQDNELKQYTKQKDKMGYSTQAALNEIKSQYFDLLDDVKKEIEKQNVFQGKINNKKYDEVVSLLDQLLELLQEYPLYSVIDQQLVNFQKSNFQILHQQSNDIIQFDGEEIYVYEMQ